MPRAATAESKPSPAVNSEALPIGPRVEAILEVASAQGSARAARPGEGAA